MRSLLVFCFLALCMVANAQIIDFPDANFKNALVNTLCADTDGDNIGDADADLNNDGEIDVSEVLQVTYLNVSNKEISNLDGIGNFENLVILDCSNNQLTMLVAQGLTKLIKLICDGNQLTSLNVQGLAYLNSLYCYANQLTSLNVQGLTSLKKLYCASNQLTNLDVQGLINLEVLDCGSNQLTNLDVQGLINLIALNCYSNQMISMDVQGLTNLEYLNCSQNKLASLAVVELLNLESLDCSYNHLNFLDVKGLNSLFTLNCGVNQLAILDVKGLIKLISFDCNENLLKNLDVSELINLGYLNCNENQLTSLELQGLSNLKELECSYNKLTSLNVNGATSLTLLRCDNNNIISIDLESVKNLRFLDCSHNNLDSLVVNNLYDLTHLICSENQLVTLDVIGLEKLFYLECYSNDLRSLFMKAGNDELAYFIFNNFQLEYICCNESLIEQIQEDAILYGYEDCVVNSYCTFTPGGKFYALDGETLYDGNTNGCDDLDIKLPRTKFIITNDSIKRTFITSTTGRYRIPLQADTYTITPKLEYPEAFTITPAIFTVTFPSTSDTITQNFCITPKGIFRQTNITVIPLSPQARPGYEVRYKIIWENAGNQIESGTLNFTYDETLLDYISATHTADQVADGIVKWNFTNLLPFEKREIIVTLKVNKPTDTPPVNVGDKLYLTAYILNEFFTIENTVVGSYDPNDKTCLQGDRVHPDMIGKYVDYLIRFENTGNYAAENVVVKDIIDTKTFDVSTLKITDASHEVYTRIEGNKVEFIFENINLPFDDANNDGYIAFKIKTLPTLVLGDSLKNLADIYFDYNFPIRTNEAQTSVAFPVSTKDIATEVNIYPNPVRDILHISTKETWTKAEIYDISGRIMRSVTFNGLSIDVGGLESGTYFMRVKNGEKVGLVKFVKM